MRGDARVARCCEKATYVGIRKQIVPLPVRGIIRNAGRRTIAEKSSDDNEKPRADNGDHSDLSKSPFGQEQDGASQVLLPVADATISAEGVLRRAVGLPVLWVFVHPRSH